ncbi:MAG: ABC transporter permease subunit [Armatimonadota bacterium]
MNLRDIYLISMITFKEMTRKGLFYLILFFSGGIIVFSYYMNFFSLGSQAPIIKDFSISSMTFFSVVLTIALSMTLIPAEIENKTIYPILSKPVRRYEYILGKFFGVMLLVALNLVILTVLLSIILGFKEGSLNFIIFKAGLLILAECMVICALTIFLSMFVTPPVNFALMFFIFLFGNLSHSYVGYIVGIMLAGASGAAVWLTYITAFIMQAVKTVLPTFALFNIKDAIVHGYAVSNAYAAEIILYALLYTSCVIMLTYLKFEDKDL